MAVDVSHASLPYPIKNTRFSLTFPMYNTSFVLTDPTTPAGSVSKDNGAFGAAAETPTVIGSGKGAVLTTFSGAETNCSALVASVSGTGVTPTLATLNPRNLVISESGTAQSGSASQIQLQANAGVYDMSQCFVRTTGGAGGGGTGGANNQARKIKSYDPATKIAIVDPNFETPVDGTTTYDILLPEGVSPAMIASSTDAGTARAGTNNTIQLATGAPSTSLIDQTINLTGGAGSGQSAVIIAYDIATKIATVDESWPTTNPDNTTKYVVVGTAQMSLARLFARAFSTKWQSKTYEEMICIIAAMVAGVTSGAGTTSETFKAPDGTVAATVTNNGTDRTTTTLGSPA